MKRRNNLHQLLMLVLLMSISMMACKKKKDKELFPDPINTNNNNGGPLTTIMDLPFTEEFEKTDFQDTASTSTAYAIPPRWYEGFATGAKTDRGWGFSSKYGINNTGCMAASAFGGNSGTDNSYLITGPFNFSNYPVINIRFQITNYNPSSKPGKVLLKYSTNYSGSGNIDAAGVTWTEVASATSQIPATNSSDYVEVISDLSSIRDSKVYIAFQFTDGTSGNSATFDLDHVLISNSTIAPTLGGGSLTETIGLPFTEEFEEGISAYAIPARWYEGFATGAKTDRGWGYSATYGINNGGCMAASAYGGATGTDNAYLITGPFNFSNYPTINIRFQMTDYNPSSKPGKVLLKYSTNYSGTGNIDAAGVTWTEVTSATSQIPTTSNSNYAEIISDLSSIRDTKVYIAFQFTDGTSANSATFDLDHILISNSTIAPTIGGGSLTQTVALPFTDDFEGGTPQYSIPAGWAQVFATGSKTDRGWGASTTHGVGNSACMSASAYGGATGTDNAYLITGPFNFSNYSTINVKFDITDYNPSSKPGAVKFVYSTDYTGSGSPDAATWTDVTSVTSQIPTANSPGSAYTTVIGDLSSIQATKVYVAFQSTGGTSAGSATFEMDNFELSNTTITP